jgi:pimeloyl-ACP methyl ester carboxylesterase
MKRAVIAGIVILSAMCAALGSVKAQDSITPTVEWDTCPFPVPPGEVEGMTIECGYLIVPQDRANPGEITIELAFAILRSAHALPDPLLYLEGGPGGSALAGLEDWVDSPYRDQRDIVLLDQRGTGFSWPRLTCDNTSSDSDDEIEALKMCRARLEQDYGVDLSDYNSADSAADVADLRVALGYEAWNLYGISYGTRLALTVMRDHPQGLRSVVLDSVYPPVVDAYEEDILRTHRVFQVLFAGCAADAACDSAYPDLENRFYRLVDQWNAQPVYIEDLEADVNGDDVVMFVFDMLYDTAAIPYLPMAIDGLDRGAYDTFVALYGGGLPGDLVMDFVDEVNGITEDWDDNDYTGFWDTVVALDPDALDALAELIRASFDPADADYLLSLIADMTADQRARVIAELQYDDYVFWFVDEVLWITEDWGDDNYDAFWDEVDALAADGVDELAAIVEAWFEPDDADYLLGLLDDMTEDELARLIPELQFVDVSDSEGMFNAVECNEEIPFNSLDEARDLAAQVPVQLRAVSLDMLEGQLETCAVWESGTASAIEDAAVASDIPTLILTGQYDPVTPPEWGQIAASTLPNSFYFEFPGVGHSAIDAGACPVRIGVAFLNAPAVAPDARCLAGMGPPAFVVPQ